MIGFEERFGRGKKGKRTEAWDLGGWERHCKVSYALSTACNLRCGTVEVQGKD